MAIEPNGFWHPITIAGLLFFIITPFILCIFSAKELKMSIKDFTLECANLLINIIKQSLNVLIILPILRKVKKHNQNK